MEGKRSDMPDLTDEELSEGLRVIAANGELPATNTTTLIRSRIRRRGLLQTLAVAGAATAVVVGTATLGPNLLSGTPDGHSNPAAAQGSTLPTTPGSSGTSVPAGPITPTMPSSPPPVQKLLDQVGVVLDPPSSDPKVTEDQAIASAQASGFKPIDDTQKPVAGLYDVTTLHFGQEEKPGQIEPKYEQHLSWVVTLPRTQQQAIGAIGSEPAGGIATPIILVDAVTGDIMISYTL